MFDNASGNALKVCRKAMRTASKDVAKQIRGSIPKRWRKLVKYKVGKLPGGMLYARAGLYNTKATTDGKTWDWFKAYWANYGTMSRRDPSHTFQFKVKPKSKHRRQSVGQPAQRFFEESTAGWEDVFVTSFENEVKKNEKELYDR